MESVASGAPASPARLVVIGNFDGVHRGHRVVLDAAMAEARAEGLLPTLLTFHPHPSDVLSGTPRPWLSWPEEKKRLLAEAAPGLEVAQEPFTLELAAMAPEEFAERVLRDRFSARVVIVGENFRFGRARAGDLTRLADLGARLGFRAHSVPLLSDERGPLSSTRVRRALAAGDLDEAAYVLGRPYAFEGVVVRGDGRGRTIGVPTANLDHIDGTLPGNGVYAAFVEGAGAGRVGAVLNIGSRPTVERPHAVEAHLLDFAGEIYGARLRVTLTKRLRDVQRFAGLPELTAQIARDIEAARHDFRARSV